MASRRVAVTGLGAICALGRGVEPTWAALADGRSGIGPIESVDGVGLRFSNGAQVRDFDPEGHFDSSRADLLDRFAQFALFAAREALSDSGVTLTAEMAERTAVYTGSCLGGQSTQDAGFVELYRRGAERMHPLSIPRVMANAGASQVAMELGVRGPCCTMSTACSSANHAIGHAFWLVRGGMAELALAGGSEAPFSFGHLKAWEALRVIAPDTCRPFCRDRLGMILGEGGAMLVLEPLEAAEARGARVYAEISGFGMSADAHHVTQPTVDGPVRAMRAALSDAGLAPEQVGYVNAHGTGTRGNDTAEARAIREVFGPRSASPAVSSTKSMHGHALGAAGALEAVATLLALHRGILPPTANFTVPDPECDVDVVTNQARTARVEAALSNSFAFGGLNAVLAFRSRG
jgi:nodulation protein E